MIQYHQRSISMLDIHISLCSIAWGIVVLLPPNNLFKGYITLHALGSWGVNEFVSGILAIVAGICLLCLAVLGDSKYFYRRFILIGGCAWWVLVTLSSIHIHPTPPAVGIYLTTAIMCGVQAVRAKGRSRSRSEVQI